MLKLHTSNRLEALARSLAETMRSPLRSPFEPERIVVQSQGMARWLKLQLAQHQGICSNCQFPFPQAFTYAEFHSVLPELPEEAVYEPDLLVWRIMRQLPQLLDQPGFEGLKSYLTGEPDSRKLYQLADRIGYLFDQYLVFRPELVLQWEKGATVDWQSRLWRGISGAFQNSTRRPCNPGSFNSSDAQTARSRNCPSALPYSGFRPSLPFTCAYLRHWPSTWRSTCFSWQPCEEFWGYISSGREQEKTLKRAGKGATEAGQLHWKGAIACWLRWGSLAGISCC